MSRKAYLSGFYEPSRAQSIYGTAEAVPFVRQSFPPTSKVSEEIQDHVSITFQSSLRDFPWCMLTQDCVP
jgi:hypothetical protein